MASGLDRHHTSTDLDALDGGLTVTDLPVRGVLPPALSGQYVQIGPRRLAATAGGGGQVLLHAVTLDGGRAVTYRSRSLSTDAVAATLVPFDHSVLLFGDGTLAHQVDLALGTVRPLDLAGGRRVLAGEATVDPGSGELHLLTAGPAGAQLHVAVSRGALSRTIRPIEDAPAPVRQLVLTRDHVVLLADGVVALTARAGADPSSTWYDVDTHGGHLVAAYERGDTVVVHVSGATLSRWTLDRRAVSASCDVVDPTPTAFAATSTRSSGAQPGVLWTVASGTVHQHDLTTGRRRSHDFGPGRHAGPLTFVPDPQRDTEAGGWVLAFLHDRTHDGAELAVLDAETVDGPLVASVSLPGPVPYGADGAWTWAPGCSPSDPVA